MDWMTHCLQSLLYLVELCDNIDVPDSDGWTPLMYAATSGSSAIIKYLIQRGANPNLKQVGPIPIPPYPVLYSEFFHTRYSILPFSYPVFYSPVFHTRYSIPPYPVLDSSISHTWFSIPPYLVLYSPIPGTPFPHSPSLRVSRRCTWRLRRRTAASVRSCWRPGPTLT